MRIGFQRLVAGEDFLRDGSGAVECRDRREQVIGADVMRLKHTAAAGDIAGLRRTGPFQAAARLRLISEDGDVPARDFTVPDQKDRRRERSNPSADKVKSGLLSDWII